MMIDPADPSFTTGLSSGGPSQTTLSQCPRLIVRIDDKSYQASDGRHFVALKNLAFEVGTQEFFSILGPSGSGKSTLLKLIAGLDRSYNGQIRLDGVTVRSPTSAIGMVFQEARLLPWLTVAQNIAFALPSGMEPHSRSRRADEMIELVGLSGFGNSWPSELSGGMEKRVGLARALANPVQVLLMDEPFSALDVVAKLDLYEKVAEISARSNLSVVLVTHDIDEAIYLSDRIALFSPAPATILKEYAVAFTRPRSRTSDEATALKAQIVDDILRRVVVNRL